MSLEIKTVRENNEYRPGETIRGSASWALEDEPMSAEARLYWRTSGKGTPYLEITAKVPFEAPGKRDQRQFSFTLPEQPISFSGRLLSVCWALDLVVNFKSRPEDSARLDITVSPNGKEFLAGEAGAPPKEDATDLMNKIMPRFR